MAETDRYGLPLSTKSAEAAEAYREGIDLALSAWPGSGDALDRAIAIDPRFAMAHAARARVHFGNAETAAARARIAIAQELVATGSPSDRERSHIATLTLGIEGQPMKSLDRALSHLDAWPADALIMSLPLGAFGLFAFSGRDDHNQARVTLCERHAKAYGNDWWFQTYYGWSLTENGDPAAGQSHTQSGFDQRRRNANAAHALAHAMFEAGSVDEAEAFLGDWLPVYPRTGILHAHIHWHRALLALEHGRPDHALSIYDDHIKPEVTAAVPLNAMTDCSALLWRLELAGAAVPPSAWRQARDYATAHFPNSGISFADVHMGLIAAATGDQDALDRRVAELEKRYADGKLPTGRVVPEACRAVAAFASRDYARCVALLEPVAGEVVRIGGSHAQRELLEDTLLVAYMRSGETAKARTLLDRRLHRRPSSRDSRWLSALPA